MDADARQSGDADAPAPPLGVVADGVHKTRFRVYFEDTDGGGVVYHAKYLHFLERARTQFLALAGFEQSILMAADPDTYLGFVVRRAAIDFHAPARLDDVLLSTTRITRLGRASLDFDQDLSRDDTPIAAAQIAVACVDKSGRPRAMPAAMRETLLSLTNT